MTTATQGERSETSDQPEAASRYAVLFELEGIAGSARQATFNVLQRIFGEQGVEFLPAHLSRFCLHPVPETYVGNLLSAFDAPQLSANSLAENLRTGVALELSSPGGGLTDTVRKVLDLARRHGIQLATVSSLPPSTAGSLLEGLGLNEWGVKLNCESSEAGPYFPRADSWLKLAKLANREPFHCGVIATSKSAAKSALSAGMHCVALPDRFTAFQDFGGVDVVVEPDQDVAPEEILRALCPHYDL